MSRSNWLFDTIRVKKPRLNSFDLGYENRFSCDFGQLVPIVCKEVLPGDKWRMNFSSLVRLAPMVSPLMGRIDVDIRAFFVPNRLVFPGWEEFITGGVDGHTTYQVPPYDTFVSGRNYYTYHDGLYGPGSLCDFLGLHFNNLELLDDLNISMLPIYAYNQIYNDWFRDELLDDLAPMDVSSDAYKIRYRRFQKDYFTSARPYAQIGSATKLETDLTFPDMIVSSDGDFKLDPVGYSFTPPDPLVRTEDGTVSFSNGSSIIQATQYKSGIKVEPDIDSEKIKLNLGTIAELRRAFKIQEWREKNSRCGNRYIESILSHFGVRSSDARLQRSQYIGGYSSPVVISDVQQTAASQSTTTPIGTLAGKGVSAGQSQNMVFTSEEHGHIICIMSILPHLAYSQGMDKKFMRLGKFDFAWPEFANIGEQAIVRAELFNDGKKDLTFGYQSRYAEYKASFDEVHGEFLTSLNSWVQQRKWTEAPVLSSEFIDTESEQTNMNNIFATQNVPGTNHLYCQVYCDLKALRPLPKYSIPSLL